MILSNMLQHIGPFDEALITLRAGVRPLVRMASAMRHQVPFAREIFRAYIALERPLRRYTLRMGTLMKQ